MQRGNSKARHLGTLSGVLLDVGVFLLLRGDEKKDEVGVLGGVLGGELHIGFITILEPAFGPGSE